MEDKNAFKLAIQEISSLDSLKKVMESYNISFKKDSSGYYTKCMFHNDKTPSLRITEMGGKAIYNCFGCEAKGDIINFISEIDKVDNTTSLKRAYEILGKELKYNGKNFNYKLLSFENFIRRNNETLKRNNEIYNLEDIYVYFDEESKPLYCKTKYKNSIGKKYFTTKSLIETDKGFKYGDSKDFEVTEKVLYNLPQVKKSIYKDNWIFFVEGEKDVETLKKLNLCATTIYTKKWQDSYSEDLKNAKIALLGDSGRAGEEFKNFVLEKLKKCCKSIKIINLPDIEKIGDGKNKDVTDWLESDKTVDDLINILKKSRDILDKSLIKQDENGIYKIVNNQIKEIRVNITNFQIIDATIFRNKDNKDQLIKLTVLSNTGKKDEIKMNARECFSDVSIFRKNLGIDYIFYGEINDLARIQEWIINYLIKEDISIYTTTGIREVDGENVLITNKGILKVDGEFNTKGYAINSIHNIDFKNIKELNKYEAEELAKYLFNFDSKENVYNTLGLGIVNILNSYAKKSNMDNLPILQNLGDIKCSSSNVLKILRLLFNDTKPSENLPVSKDSELLEVFDETYLPVFLEDIQASNLSDDKINSLVNYICSNTDYKSSLIISSEEEIEVKSSSNIVWYDINNFTSDIKQAMDILCNSKRGENLLRCFSKSLYLYVLRNFTDETFELEYLIIKNKYEFESKLNNPREVNTATYTMMGINLLYNTFTELGVNMDEVLDLEEASDIIIKNIKENVLEGNISKSKYEQILEDINNLVCIEDKTIKIEEDIHFKILSNCNQIAFDFKTIYDKLNRYYKVYKDDNEKLLNYKTFIKMISKSPYITDSDIENYYKPIKRKVLVEDENGLKTYDYRNKNMFILKLDRIKELEMDNILPDDSDEFEF
ncbi:CHC2 zinc finger domain-containing protein [Terrisporobacter sp.]